MLQCLYPLQQIIFHHFFGPLMDDKNLLIEPQLVKALFVLQILDNVCVRVCVCLCVCVSLCVYGLIIYFK